MDPEIQRALQDGIPPEAIAAELQRRKIPVPPELSAMLPQEPSALSQYGPTAAAGAAAAGTLGGAGYAANQAFNPKHRARRLLTQAVQESGGPQTLEDVLMQFQSAGKGDLATLGDLTKRMGAVTDFVATNNPAARATLSDIHEARQGGVPKRIAGDAETVLGGYQAPNYLSDVAAKSQSQWAASDLGYEGLRKRNPILGQQATAKLKAFVESPTLHEAWKQAAEVGTIGPMPKAGAVSFETLQGMKERLDDAIGSAFSSGRGPLGARLAKARDQLVDVMGEAIPEYRPVATTYHQFSKKQEMLKAGQDAWKTQMQVPDLELTWRELSPEDQKTFRQGLGGAVFQDIENAQTNRNLAKQLLSSSAATEKKLELVFEGPKQFQEFVSRLKLEKQMASMGELIGGSATARRGAQMADVADQTIGAADAAMHPMTSASAAVLKAPKYLAGPTAERLAPLFTEQGVDRLLRILRSLPK